MSYEVFIKPSARKELETLPDPLLQRVDRAAMCIGSSSMPFPGEEWTVVVPPFGFGGGLTDLSVFPTIRVEIQKELR